MRLIVVHQILIASAIGLGVLFGIRAGVVFARTGATSELVIALSSGLVAVALALYLKKVRAKWSAERRSGSPS
jgi:hypothetical protein